MAKEERNFRYNIRINGKESAAELAKIERATMTLEQKLQKLERAENRNEKVIAEVNAELQASYKHYDTMRKTIDINVMSIGQLEQHLKIVKREYKNFDPGSERWKQAAKEMKQCQDRLDEFNGVAKNLGKGQLVGIAALGTALGNLASHAFNFLKKSITDTFNKIKEFEQANANLASILGTTRKEIKLLTEEAKRLGASTEYTASQVTMLQTELAKLGFSMPEISKMTEDILNFATATGADLPAAAALAGASMRAFGLEASDMNRVVSTLAVGTTKSALSFSYLESAMSTIAPIAKTFGFTIEDTTALLGTLANSGFNASSAATATRNILLNLADANGKLAKALGQPIRSLNDLVPALAKLKEKGVDLNETLELTDKRSVAAFNTFLDGAESIGKLRDSVTNVGDELKFMVEERLNTVEGSTKMLNSAWEGLMLSFSNSSGFFKSAIDWVTSLVNWLNKAIDASKELTESEAWKNKFINPYKDDELKRFTKSFEDRIRESYDPSLIYQIEKGQAEKSLKEAEDAFNKFMDNRNTNIRLGIIKSNEWSKAEKNNYNILKLAVQQATESISVLDSVYSKFKTKEETIEPLKSKSKGKENEVKSALEQQLKTLENNYKKRQLIINLNENQEWETENEHQSLLLEAEKSYLDDRVSALEKFHSSYQKLNTEAENKLLEDKLKRNENSRKQDENNIASLKKTTDEQLKSYQTLYDREASDLKVQLDNKEITEEQYSQKIKTLDYNTAFARMDALQAFGKSLENLEIKNGDIKTKAVKESNENILKSERDTQEKLAALTKIYKENDLNILKEYGKLTSDELKKQELDRIEALRNNKKQDENGELVDDPLISQEVYEAAKAAIVKKYEDEKLKVRQQYGIASMSELYNSELELLLEQHEKGLLSEDEYQRALLELKLKYAQEYADKAGEFAKIGSDTVKAFSEAETASLDAEYTKRQSNLTEQYNQGIISQEEYNAQKEELDYEQKSKELEIQKKYADVNFAMQAAEIISSGATAAINAYKALAGIPIVGPGMGAAAAALVAVTTAMRLKQAKAERDRVKAMTLESPGGGSGSAPKTGEIRMKEGFAEGGLHTDGGYTGDGDCYRVAGRFPDGQPYHRGEYIIATPELRKPKILDMVRNIESVRRQRTNKNAIPGFAEGGLHTSATPRKNPNDLDVAAIGANGQVFSRILTILQRLETGDIVVQTNYGITEMEAEQKRKTEQESKFSKK